MAEELRAVRGVDGERHAGHGPAAHAPRRAAVPRAAARSRDRLPRLQPARCDRDVAVGHRLADRALERRRRALRRRGAGSQGAGGGGRRRSRGHGHAAARRAISCAPRRSSSRRRAARCSRRTRSSRRWATCSACRTTSPDASSRRCRCRWPAAASPTPDAPHDARAYELYLRANELARTYDGLLAGARPLPALPRAGSAVRSRVGPPRPLPSRDRQVHRRPRPTARARAEEAFRRALALNPRLSVAHKFYANLEADIGQAQRGTGAPARRGPPSRQRSGALRGARARVPLLRALRRVHRRARRGSPPRPERARPASTRRC